MLLTCTFIQNCKRKTPDCKQRLQVAVDCKMVMDIEDYATSFRPDIIDAVSGWCQGATFAKILTLTDVFEVGPLALQYSSSNDWYIDPR